MEKLKVKHDHNLTDIIKVGIFALFLILPILVFLPNCLYYGFNEHATNETTTQINYKYQSNEVNTLDDLVVGNIYQLDEIYLSYNNDFILDINIYSYNCTTEVMYYLSQNSTFIDAQFDRNYNNKDSFIHLSIDNGEMVLSFPNSQNLVSNLVYSDYEIELNNVVFFIEENNLNDFKDWFELYGNNLPHYTDYNVIESVDTNVDNTITQSVTNAWQRMWETPMLNWTSNNTFQFTINAFTNIFGITTESKMANYLTYLLVITCIYLIFDIVLTLTTKLTHLINAK